MKHDEYRTYDAVGLAELVARRDVSPVELLDAAMARLEAVNPKLNAVVSTFADRARERIAKQDLRGPFAGVPLLLKDAPMAGVITNPNSKLYASGAPEAADSALVAAYRESGFVIFGKTNFPEFGLGAITEPTQTGTTLNPWNFELTCGGSSGGAASAVASGILPVAQASDGGGSIRIPASCCGLFGLKPSHGRVSIAPARERMGGASIRHALTRSVRDSAAMLDVSCRPQPGDPYFLESPEQSYASQAAQDPPRLRIAVLRTRVSGQPIQDACVQAVDDAARLCESLGHHVEEAWLPINTDALTPDVMKVVGAGLVMDLDAETKRRGRPLADDDIEPQTRLYYEEGRRCSGADYVWALEHYTAVSRQVLPFFQKYDVLLLSTLGSLPIPVGLMKNPSGDLQQIMARYLEYCPNTLLFNVTGQPAMSVPLFWSERGMPIGVQFAGKVGAEGLLFRLAGQLERARPWFDRVPPEISAVGARA